ncbi:MAG: glycyl-radical enzyme activating protein [Deltaproteobacteria bacterium]|nr:glycyl-radical enzyme activating protein [Deltaproteobacteria bacterium]MBW2393565.1 glycyl-radical enzyme activating protein [Deltaproteobacteria bacterium]
MTRPHEAVVFDIQRFSIHDGPGIRTSVFFKGCALACAWCQNPEALHAAPELTYDVGRCLEACTSCLAACAAEAIRPEPTDRVDFARCTGCGDCVDPCPSGALRMIGQSWSVPDLLHAVLRDRDFFEPSGGGVTFSGGEPVLQSQFLQELLPLLREQRIHVAIETCGAYPFELVEPLLGWIDLVLFDLKVIDPIRHARFTSRDNDKILTNLNELLRRAVPLELRMPVVPGWNTDPANLEAIAKLLTELGVPSLTLLPYNHLWEAKLPRLGTGQQPLGIEVPDEDFYLQLRNSLESHGIQTRI